MRSDVWHWTGQVHSSTELKKNSSSRRPARAARGTQYTASCSQGGEGGLPLHHPPHLREEFLGARHCDDQAELPYRIHHSVLHLPRPRSHSQVKNFLLRKQNKTKNHSRKGVEGRRILENIKPLTSGGSQRAHAEAGPSKSSSWCCRLSSSPRSVWGEGKETG